VLLAASAAALLGLTAAPALAQDTPDPSTTLPETSSTSSTLPPPEAQALTGGTKGHPIAAATEDLAARGYTETEALLRGTAQLHGPKGAWRSDGEWDTTDLGPVDYATRLLVRRPSDPARFDGTVYVSWLDVSAAVDFDAVWAQVGEEVLRQGAAWVGVSAQYLGIQGPLGAKAWDPPRYGELSSPGDGASYDIFTQAAQLLRAGGSGDPLAGLAAQRRLIAVGAGQSAQRLVTYLNAFQPSSRAFDGFLLLSRFRGAAPLGRALLPPAEAVDPDGSKDLPYLPDPLAALLSGPPAAQVRADTDVPVFTVITETEARKDRPILQPDGDLSRTWEIAGATHADATATAALKEQLRRDFPKVPLGQLECKQPNDLPTRYADRAALRALATWVATGTPPPTAKPIDRTRGGDLQRDADGNAKGGLRLPQLAVPTAAYSGESSGTGYCALTGSAVPFSASALAKRYPTPEAYVTELGQAIDAAVAAGHLLPEDAAELLQVTPVPGTQASAAAVASGEVDLGSSAAPAGPAASERQDAAEPSASAEVEAQQSSRAARGWMATTGRDLLTPLLAGLLLVLNGRVVMTIARQRRRAS
jgi:hypothetical protein